MPFRIQSEMSVALRENILSLTFSLDRCRHPQKRFSGDLGIEASSVGPQIVRLRFTFAQRQNSRSARCPYRSSLCRRELGLFSYLSNRKEPIFYSVIALATAVYVGVYSFIPITIYSNAVSDDGLYISHARFLSVGYWLGPFNQ